MDTLADLNTIKLEGFALQGNRTFSVPLYSHIVGNLWAGGCPVNVAPTDFQFIVCLYPWESYKRHEHQTYVEARLYDSANIPDSKILYSLAKYVSDVSKIGATLVHCQMGLNRSALVAALSLIVDGMKAQDAINLMREKRGNAALCNKAFEAWLLEQG